MGKIWASILSSITRPVGIIGWCLLVWRLLDFFVAKAGDVEFLTSNWEGIKAVLDHQAAVIVSIVVGFLFVAIAIHDSNPAQADVPGTATLAKAQELALTPEQREFRIALKQFVLICPKELTEAMGKVIRLVVDEERKQNWDTPHSVAIAFFAHQTVLSYPDGLTDLLKLETVKIEDMNAGLAMENILRFLHYYRVFQQAIGTMNAITKLPIQDLEPAKEWLDADERCRQQLERLIAGWPDQAEPLKRELQKYWAKTGRAWAEPHRINYNAP